MVPNLPDLTQLSHAQKDALILMLWPLQRQVQDLMAQMAVMQERIKELEGRLALNSKNSSKPPSSDGLSKPAPKSLRVAAKNSTGGQNDHPGSTLSQVVQPDKVVVHDVPDHCKACHCALPFSYVSETRQVFDLPVVKYASHRAPRHASHLQLRPGAHSAVSCRCVRNGAIWPTRTGCHGALKS